MPDHNEQVCLAVDWGAESGRVVAGVWDGRSIGLSVVHRFPNGPVRTEAGLRWDFNGLLDQTLQGLKLANERWPGRIVSIGVDTWGVDYGLLDEEGSLLAQPFHYRDSRTQGMQDEAFRRVPKREIYNVTGIQFLPFNTIYQLLAESSTGSEVYRRARHMLFIPDLINHHLTGRLTNEVTIASTSQLLDAQTRRWSLPLIKKLGLRDELFGDLVEPGEQIGCITPAVAQRTGLSPDVRIFAVGSHDTASAVAGVPASGDRWAYLSSGTWSLLGMEVNQPVISELGFGHGFTNEAGVYRTTRLLKNISGLWLLQECRRQWQRDGMDYTYAQLNEMAAQQPPTARTINPDDPAFAEPGNMPERINHYLLEHGCEPCGCPAQMARLIFESLALRYRDVLRTLEEVTGTRPTHLHIVGGGSQSRLLNQLTADATGCQVVAGPVEATALGNIATQLIALGAITDLPNARTLIRKHHGVTVYDPVDYEDTASMTRQP